MNRPAALVVSMALPPRSTTCRAMWDLLQFSTVARQSLGYGIALGYVPAELASPATELGIRIRDRVIPGVVAQLPFYTEGSVRR